MRFSGAIISGGGFGMKLDFFRQLISPVGMVVEDERLQYRRMLEEAHERQAMRDLMAEAYIENTFWGVPYRSIFEEYSDLADQCGLKFKKK
jgi:hypothetical protein